MANEHKAGTAVPHEADGKKPFPPLDPNNVAPQLVWLAISFVALYLLLKKIALPRVGDVITARRDRIQGDLDAAERAKADAERALADYEQAHADARGKAAAISRETQDRLTGEVDKRRAELEAQLGAKLAAAEKSIEATKSKALASVNDVAAEVATSIVAKLVGTTPSADEVRKALTNPAAE
jgi:F-type H+-transporting ATPase subunit b